MANDISIFACARANSDSRDLVHVSVRWLISICDIDANYLSARRKAAGSDIISRIF